MSALENASGGRPYTSKTPGNGTGTFTITLPKLGTLLVESVVAQIDASASTGAVTAELTVKDSAGVVIAAKPQRDTLATGSTQRATWALRLDDDGSPAQELFPRNLGELGMSGTGAQGLIHDHTIQFENVLVGDGILVSAQAPSLPAALTNEGTPVLCNDAVGNFYLPIDTHLWEASPPNVNQGARQVFFFCAASIAPLVVGVDFIEVQWDQPVFDRSIDAWLVRHDGGAVSPPALASTTDNNAAVFASNQVTLASPAFTPSRDNGLAFATTFACKAGGVGGFGGVAGYSGYLEIQSRGFSGLKQIYTIHQSTYGANALDINPFGGVPYEIDLGQLPGGVPVGAFNGVAQFYTAGANAWKGIVIHEID